MKFALILLLALSACAPLPDQALPDTAQTQLYGLINERLSYMPDVARYKYERQLPVEDLGRERQILDSIASDAGAQGLDPNSVEPFFQAQFDAAKRIQANVMLELEAEKRQAGDYRDLKTVVRPELDRLGKEILESLASCLRRGCEFNSQEFDTFSQIVDNPNLSARHRQEIFDGLGRIQLAS